MPHGHLFLSFNKEVVLKKEVFMQQRNFELVTISIFCSVWTYVLNIFDVSDSMVVNSFVSGEVMNIIILITTNN